MFIIKQNQIKDLDKILLDSLTKRLEVHLKDHFARIIEQLDKDQLVHFINEGLIRASNYGLETEYQITVYFNIMLTLGVEFETNNNYLAASEILNDQNITSDEKIERLIKYVEQK